jgi:hypothetical protein
MAAMGLVDPGDLHPNQTSRHRANSSQAASGHLPFAFPPLLVVNGTNEHASTALLDAASVTETT